ncbi:MAG: helix-turn-helix domain-containing protein [Rhodobacteraceae bacterium]|nr:helix-turn-helix domain-containing protein [Paracoccaceae bacterium]
MSKSIYNEEYRKLIDALKSARITAGMTQQQVADALGKPQSFVAKVEGFERRLDIIEFWRIALLLEANPIELLKANLG